ncbi:MAG: methylmalonyl-CoA mutase, partial [Nocardioidaceae bacterium]
MEAELSLDTGEHEHTRAVWEKAAADALRKSGRLADDDPDDAVWAALAGRTPDGIEVPPLGTPELTADL